MPIRWIPVVVVHGVSVMWIAPRSGRIVSMVGVGDKGCLLPGRGRLRSRRDRNRGFHGSNFVLVDCGVCLRGVGGSATGVTVQGVSQIRHGKGAMIFASRWMPLDTTLPCEPTRRIQVTDLDSNPAAIVNAVVLSIDSFPGGFCVVKFNKRKGRPLLHGYKQA